MPSDKHGRRTSQEISRVIVAGSRSITDKKVVRDAINNSPHTPYHGELVAGAADGVDTIAKDFASTYQHVDYKEFEAEWDKYGPSAGPIRNERMADYAHALIAVWDGESPGTKNMIDAAIEHGLNIYVEVHNGR